MSVAAISAVVPRDSIDYKYMPVIILGNNLLG